MCRHGRGPCAEKRHGAAWRLPVSAMFTCCPSYSARCAPTQTAPFRHTACCRATVAKDTARMRRDKEKLSARNCRPPRSNHLPPMRAAESAAAAAARAAARDFAACKRPASPAGARTPRRSSANSGTASAIACVVLAVALREVFDPFRFTSPLSASVGSLVWHHCSATSLWTRASTASMALVSHPLNPRESNIA